MFNAIGSLSTRRPWLVIGAWVIVAIALTTIGQAKLYDVTTTDTSSFLPTSYESAKAVKFGEEHFGRINGATVVTGLVRRPDSHALTPTDRGNVDKLIAAMPSWRVDWDTISGEARRPKDARALEPQVVGMAGGARDELVSVQFKGNAADPSEMKAFKQFRSVTSDAFSAKHLSIGFTGGIAEQADITDATKSRTELEQYLLFGAVIVLMGLFFRGVLSSILPLLLVLVVGGAGTGTVVLAAKAFGFHLDSSVPQLIQVVLIGIGIDYFLFMVFRFRERLRLGEDRKLAALHTATHVSRVVASAALAIVVAFATLGLAHFGQFRVIGPSVAISVAVMLVAGITLMPALLAATGPKLFWPSTSWQRTRKDGAAVRLGSFVARRPGRVAVVTGTALAVLAVAAAGVKMSYDGGSGPAKTQSARVQRQIERLLPKGVTDRQQIYVDSTRPLTAAALRPLRRRLAQVRYVAEVSPAQVSRDRRAAEIDLSLTIDSATSKAIALAKKGGPLRTAAHNAAPPGAVALVAGNASIFADVANSVNSDLKLIFPVAALLLLLILFVVLRSAVAPLYLLPAVALEFAATLGAAVLVYQHAQHRNGVIFTLPLTLFLFVAAIGTDYNILIASRLREELENGASVRAATARAIGAVAPAITAAGLVLAASFSTLMLNKDVNSKQIGFGMAVGILFASFVVSTLFVPAVTTLIGEKAWWPRRPRAAQIEALARAAAPEGAQRAA
jgi:putative drug exporter of the RND superfamily